MSRIKVTLNRKAVAQLLKSPDLRRDLERRANAIAQTAGPGFEADSQVGRSRARAMAYTTDLESMRAEATDRALTRAIDAGRN